MAPYFSIIFRQHCLPLQHIFRVGLTLTLTLVLARFSLSAGQQKSSSHAMQIMVEKNERKWRGLQKKMKMATLAHKKKIAEKRQRASEQDGLWNKAYHFDILRGFCAVVYSNFVVDA